MADVGTQTPQPPVPGEPKPKSPIVTFLTSTTGRLMVGGILLFAVLVVAGTLAFFFLFKSADDTAAPAVSPPSTAAQPATSTVAATEPRRQPLDDTFTFRNVFAPTVRPPSTDTEDADADDDGADTSGDSSDSANGPSDTLILKSIAVDSGVRVATFEWNGTNYEVVKGDQVDASPWQVLEIHSDSVLMLFGDSRVTLTVGQGFSGGAFTK